MARVFSNLIPGREVWKGGGLFLIVVVAAFVAVVFLLFREHSAAPRGAVAGHVPAVEEAGESTPYLAADTRSERGLAASTPTGASTPPATGRQPTGSFLPPAGNAGQAGQGAPAAIAEAMTLIRSRPGEVIEVRNRLNAVLQMPLTPDQRQAVKAEMTKLAEEWLFGPAVFASDTLCDAYMVKRGDLLDIVGRRHKVPFEILMQINNIPRPEALQAGRTLKVAKGPFHAKVYRSTFTLDLYLQDTYVRSFKVGLGAPGSETPTGLWRVKEGGKLVQPPWFDKRTNRTYKASDSDYPLGSRWIALDGLEGNAKGQIGYAIHGTKDPDQIGTAASQGCIRMYNGDAVLMYNLLVPLYSQVEVLD